MDWAEAAAIASFGVLILVELDAKGLLHIGSGAGKRNTGGFGGVADG